MLRLRLPSGRIGSNTGIEAETWDGLRENDFFYENDWF
ncbi:hypothetical protein SpAn4DRAFT_2367 [Sporomusa ovata]|uniref:Uncharacterized protein n=1 Tax=Sporomusa ovata TaxID=2378 RepID=A0A0U1L0R5_9FIRM|nr:hypothetical protein SpAn4DRAFT_2367 [Sporomusa ovata]